MHARLIRPFAVLCLPLVLLGMSFGMDNDDFFPAESEVEIDGKSRKLRRTGMGVRYKGIARIYVVASYLQEGAAAKTASDLLQCKEVKQIKMHFLLGVSGEDMAKTFETIFRGNHPEPKFKDEMTTILDYFRKTRVKRNDRVTLIHHPVKGLLCVGPTGDKIAIDNVEFSQAVWGNYLGKSNAGEDVKEALISELK